MAALSPELQRILRWLRRHHPLEVPARVYLATRLPDDEHGVIEADRKPWRLNRWVRIKLRATLPPIELREVLLHEWAHGLTAIDQDDAKSRLDHDSIFTATYTGLVEEFELAFPELKLRRHKV